MPYLCEPVQTHLSHDEATDILVAAGWPRDQIDNALCVIEHESGFDPNCTYDNTNGTVDRGLFQINSIWVSDDDPVWEVVGPLDLKRVFDPRYNAEYALAIFERWGWNLWATASVCGLREET